VFERPIPCNAYDATVRSCSLLYNVYSEMSLTNNYQLDERQRKSNSCDNLAADKVVHICQCWGILWWRGANKGWFPPFHRVPQ